jgi:hypothetical protein
MPLIVPTNNNASQFAQTRFILKNVWNTTGAHRTTNRVNTPFRVVMNAGDVLSRQNYSCGGNCQTPQSIPGVHGIKSHLGSIGNSCMPSVMYSTIQNQPLVPASACNVKFVYDGSDYTTYLKNKAINKNYNKKNYK